jgi:hypothetical protein
MATVSTALFLRNKRRRYSKSFSRMPSLWTSNKTGQKNFLAYLPVLELRPTPGTPIHRRSTQVPLGTALPERVSLLRSLVRSGQRFPLPLPRLVRLAEVPEVVVAGVAGKRLNQAEDSRSPEGPLTLCASVLASRTPR